MAVKPGFRANALWINPSLNVISASSIVNGRRCASATKQASAPGFITNHLGSLYRDPARAQENLYLDGKNCAMLRSLRA